MSDTETESSTSSAHGIAQTTRSDVKKLIAKSEAQQRQALITALGGVTCCLCLFIIPAFVMSCIAIDYWLTSKGGAALDVGGLYTSQESAPQKFRLAIRLAQGSGLFVDDEGLRIDEPVLRRIYNETFLVTKVEEGLGQERNESPQTGDGRKEFLTSQSQKFYELASKQSNHSDHIFSVSSFCIGWHRTKTGYSQRFSSGFLVDNNHKLKTLQSAEQQNVPVFSLSAHNTFSTRGDEGRGWISDQSYILTNKSDNLSFLSSSGELQNVTQVGSDYVDGRKAETGAEYMHYQIEEAIAVWLFASDFSKCFDYRICGNNAEDISKNCKEKTGANGCVPGNIAVDYRFNESYMCGNENIWTRI